MQDLLCDLDIWLGAPNDLLRSLLEHLLELASESSEKRTNIKIMRDLQVKFYPNIQNKHINLFHFYLVGVQTFTYCDGCKR